MFLESKLVTNCSVEAQPVADAQQTVTKLPNVEVTGVSVTALNFQKQISTMVEWAEHRLSKTVCVANVHMLMESRWNGNLKAAMKEADLITPDGMPLVWVMRALGWKGQDRVAGMDIFQAICEQCVNHSISLFLLGSTPEVLETMERRLQQAFPSLEIAGMESPPFRPLTNVEDNELIERINCSGANFTFVSLGCPKQECWMHAHKEQINSVMIGVGGVFPVFAGLKRRAPRWMRQFGLEWFYRLVQEPRRLFGRYLSTIPLFIFLALHQVSAQRWRVGQ